MVLSHQLRNVIQMTQLKKSYRYRKLAGLTWNWRLQTKAQFQVSFETVNGFQFNANSYLQCIENSIDRGLNNVSIINKTYRKKKINNNNKHTNPKQYAKQNSCFYPVEVPIDRSSYKFSSKVKLWSHPGSCSHLLTHSRKHREVFVHQVFVHKHQTAPII